MTSARFYGIILAICHLDGYKKARVVMTQTSTDHLLREFKHSCESHEMAEKGTQEAAENLSKAQSDEEMAKAKQVHKDAMELQSRWQNKCIEVYRKCLSDQFCNAVLSMTFMTNEEKDAWFSSCRIIAIAENESPWHDSFKVRHIKRENDGAIVVTQGAECFRFNIPNPVIINETTPNAVKKVHINQHYKMVIEMYKGTQTRLQLPHKVTEGQKRILPNEVIKLLEKENGKIALTVTGGKRVVLEEFNKISLLEIEALLSSVAKMEMMNNLLGVTDHYGNLHQFAMPPCKCEEGKCNRGFSSMKSKSHFSDVKTDLHATSYLPRQN